MMNFNLWQLSLTSVWNNTEYPAFNSYLYFPFFLAASCLFFKITFYFSIPLFTPFIICTFFTVAASAHPIPSPASQAFPHITFQDPTGGFAINDSIYPATPTLTK